MGVPGTEASEWMHHSEFALRKVSTFIGREDLIAEIVQHVMSDTNSAGTSSEFSAISAVVVGVSGTLLIFQIVYNTFTCFPRP